jgi:hypothetical protein
MNSLVGAKRLCNVIPSQLGIRRKKTIKATFTKIDGIKKTGRVDYLRYGKVRIKREE